MKKIAYMKGSGIFSIIITVILVYLFGNFIIKIAPIYFNHYIIVNNVKNLSKEDNIDLSSTRSLRYVMAKRLNINNIESIPITAFTLLKAKGGNNKQVVIKYKIEKDFLFNMSIAVKFDNIIGLN